MFTPANVNQRTSETEPPKNRITSLVGGSSARRWSGPLPPAQQPKT